MLNQWLGWTLIAPGSDAFCIVSSHSFAQDGTKILQYIFVGLGTIITSEAVVIDYSDQKTHHTTSN